MFGVKMDRVAVFVDAGYLYAGGAKSITGTDNKKRHELSLDIAVVIPYLISKAEAIAQQKLLRIYWYDAAPSNRLSTDHQILASSDNVKLRLGVINGFGEQKGVDGKIITDLAELSRNGAFADAVLLGGDEDLRIGVELAQERGSRVHLLTIEGSSSSPTLRQESDTVSIIARADIQTFLSVKTTAAIPATGLSLVASAATSATPATPMTTAAPSSTSSAAAVPSTYATPSPTSSAPASPSFTTTSEAEVKGYLAALTDVERVALTTALKTGTGVPSEHDGRLLARTRKVLGRPLEMTEKIKLRRALKKELGV